MKKVLIFLIILIISIISFSESINYYFNYQNDKLFLLGIVFDYSSDYIKEIINITYDKTKYEKFTDDSTVSNNGYVGLKLIIPEEIKFLKENNKITIDLNNYINFNCETWIHINYDKPIEVTNATNFEYGSEESEQANTEYFYKTDKIIVYFKK